MNNNKIISTKILIPRNIEVKNNLRIARGDWGRDSGGRLFRNYYKGHMHKTKGEGGSKGGR